MKTLDLINALGELDDETVLSARNVPAKTLRVRRIPRAALIAAVLAGALALGAAAYAIIHVNSVRLMQAGPISGGEQAVDIDEPAAQVIEEQSVDYGISVTDKGTTVTLESLMGYSAEEESLLYLTLTVTPPEGVTLPEDASAYGFVNEFFAFPFDAPDETPREIPAHGGSSVAVKNPDGSVSVMLLRFFGGPVEGARMKLTLEDFDLSGKAAAQAAFARWEQEKQTSVPAEEPDPLLPGSWEFDLGRLHLPTQQMLTPDQSALTQAGLSCNRLELTPFGGKLTLDDTAPSLLERLRAEYSEELRELSPEINWDELTEEEFQALLREAETSVDPDDTRLRFLDVLGRLAPWDYGFPSTVALEYPDGTSYTVDSPLLLWTDELATGEVCLRILFPAPQPILQASAILLGDARVPLN